MKRWYALFLAIAFVALLACNKESDLAEIPVVSKLTYELVLPDTPYNYADLNLPPHIANSQQLVVYAANNVPSSNPTTDEGAALGRVLFYDRRLSADNSISCGSCHHQENAFADPVRFSTGIDDQLSHRNSMSLTNMLYFRDFFWDLRADGLEAQVLQPIQDHKEMASDLDELVEELSQAEEYEPLFVEAFGDNEISADRISLALSQFVRSIVTFNSKYDQEISNDFAGFSQLEKDGKDLFLSAETRCGQCHSSYNFFTRLEPATNGLDSEVTDEGFFIKTGNEDHLGQFKIVSIRNVEVTAPYMHDGRFATLEEVIDHYSTGIQARPNLDERLTVEYEKGGTPLQMNFTDYQKSALIAFMKTLTDHSSLVDERFSDPFVVVQ